MQRMLLLIALSIAPALQAGAVLRGGSFATVERPAALTAHAEEWEAFLSLDGGRYYAFRITPHLDLARRQFTWVVPNVDAKNARILIRAGDERRETLYESPATFAIVSDARAEMPRRTIVPATNGEAARDGDPGVVAWTDGDRSGGALVRNWAGQHGSELVAKNAEERAPADAAIASGRPLCAPAAATTLPGRGAQRAPFQHATNRQRPQNVLLVSTRLNI